MIRSPNVCTIILKQIALPYVENYLSMRYCGFEFLCSQDINFWGNVYPTYVALPYLRRTNGKIIVNASVESWLPLPRMSLYAVSIYYSIKNFILLSENWSSTLTFQNEKYTWN